MPEAPGERYGKMLFDGSANLTNDANYRNHEFVIAMEDTAMIERFAAKFEELWAIGKQQTRAPDQNAR